MGTRRHPDSLLTANPNQPQRPREEHAMPYNFRLQYRYGSSVWDADYNTYRVTNRPAWDAIGYVRIPTDRAVAQRLGVRFGWDFSATGEQWLRAQYSSRQEAARELESLVAGTHATFVPRGRSASTTGARRPRSSGRYFGVEMELTGPSASTIIQALTASGIALDERNIRTGSEIGYQSTNTAGHHWTLKHDGSVNGYGLELVSPKLRGAAGFAEVGRVCEALNAAGATVNRSTGCHVHHDFRGLTVEQVRRQVVAFVERQDLIMGLVAPSRRRNATYVPQWDAYGLDRLRRVSTLSELQRIGPRGSINTHAYGVHGSIEIRAHAGTTNAKKVVAWVRFGQALFAAAEAGATVSTTDRSAMLTDLMPFGLTAEDASWLLRFETAGETRRSVEARVAALREQIAASEAVLEEVG